MHHTRYVVVCDWMVFSCHIQQSSNDRTLWRVLQLQNTLVIGEMKLETNLFGENKFSLCSECALVWLYSVPMGDSKAIDFLTISVQIGLVALPTPYSVQTIKWIKNLASTLYGTDVASDARSPRDAYRCWCCLAGQDIRDRHVVAIHTIIIDDAHAQVLRKCR